jgi:hypothetical protein
MNPELSHLYELLGIGDTRQAFKNMESLIDECGLPTNGNLLVRAITETECREGLNGRSMVLTDEQRDELADVNNAMLFEVLRAGPLASQELSVDVEPGDLVTAPNNATIPHNGMNAPSRGAILFPKAVGLVLHKQRVIDACRSIQRDRELKAEEKARQRLVNLGLADK